MEQFVNDLSYFIFGAFIGHAWHALWSIGKKVWSEAKKAQQEWKK